MYVNLNGVKLYQYKSSKGNRNYTTAFGQKGGIVEKGAQWISEEELFNIYANTHSGARLTAASQIGGYYSSGIENGPVTRTGLAMLHGSSSSPEYVLNSD
jgi:hypothetical protein